MKESAIKALRDYYALPDTVTDQQIDQELRGSFGEAMVNITIAKKALKDAVFKKLEDMGWKR